MTPEQFNKKWTHIIINRFYHYDVITGYQRKEQWAIDLWPEFSKDCEDMTANLDVEAYAAQRGFK